MKIFETLRYIEIETCSNCSRKCEWCLFGGENNRPEENSFLSTETIEKVLKDLNRNNFYGVIAFYSINEPLLDNRIITGELFERCKQIFGRRVTTAIITNGDYLNEVNTRKMFLSGLDIIKISCYDNNTFQKAVDLKQKFNRVIILDQRRYKVGGYESNRAGLLETHRNENISFKSCYMPLYRTVIGWNGKLRICCHDMVGNFDMGNVNECSFSELINSKEFNRLRKKLLTEREDISPCNKCNVDGSKDYMEKH